MVRPKKLRFINCDPEAVYFKPRGIPLRALEEICLYIDEIEAVRLADLIGLQHEEAGKRMNVSRATFGRIIQKARNKIADAIINGKAIRIEKNLHEIEENNNSMIYVCIISPEKERFLNFAAALYEKNITIDWQDSGEKALSMISEKNLKLVISDESVGDMTGIDFIKKLLKTNPMINMALVSALSSEDFHEKTEGLGILMQLPPNPDKKEAEKLITLLENILNMERLS